MSGAWWDLPGPSRFVERVAGDLNDGKNVVLSNPERVPDGLRAALRSRCQNYRTFSSIDFSLEHAEPMDCLYERYARDAPVDELRSARGLTEEQTFQRRVIWVDGDESCWPQWRDFLIRYQEACRSVALADRSLVCLALKGCSARAGSVPEDVALVHRRHQGVTSDFDMLLYVNHLVDDVSPEDPRPTVTRLRRELKVQAVAHLAAWDPDLVGPLLRQPLAEILESQDTLKEYATSRGWADFDNGDPRALWRHGAAEKLGGRWEVHSALLALRGESRILQKRLWAAELKVLLPWIEGERHDLLDTYGDRLEVPLEEEYMGSISIRDLEIGKISHFLARVARPSETQTLSYVYGLAKLRNALAHHEPIRAMHLTSVLDSLTASGR